MDKGLGLLTQKRTICLDGNLINLSSPVVMGILNVTPDSFYEGSRVAGSDAILARADEIISQGGAIIDVGGYSSRPNAENVSTEEEIRRVTEAVYMIKKRYPQIPISLDTFRAEVVKSVCLHCGSVIVNDISAGEMDSRMFETAAEFKLPYIAMHMKGRPENMQDNPVYSDIRNEIFTYFSRKINYLHSLGVNDIIIDPGFGFGKTIENNYQLLNILDDFKIFGLPLLVGFSRKSMIYRFLGTSPENALNGTTALNTVALMKGASILRVHDVKEAVEVVQLVDKLNQSYIS